MASSPLPVPGERPFDLGQLSAHLPSHISFDVQSHDRHRFQLPVTGLGVCFKADANEAVVLGELGD